MSLQKTLECEIGLGSFFMKVGGEYNYTQLARGEICQTIVCSLKNKRGAYFEEDMWKIKARAKPNGTKRIFRSLCILEHLCQNSPSSLSKKCSMPCFVSHMQEKNTFQTGERVAKRLKALYIQTPFPIFWCSLPTEKGFKTQHLFPSSFPYLIKNQVGVACLTFEKKQEESLLHPITKMQLLEVSLLFPRSQSIAPESA